MNCACRQINRRHGGCMGEHIVCPIRCHQLEQAAPAARTCWEKVTQPSNQGAPHGNG